MAASARSRAGTCRVRTVPDSVQASGMMLRAVPAWIAPTVTTHGLDRRHLARDDGLQLGDEVAGGDDRVDRIVRDRRRGRTCRSTVMSKLSAAARQAPRAKPNRPTGMSGWLWKPSAMSTPSSAPSAIMAAAPPTDFLGRLEQQADGAGELRAPAPAARRPTPSSVVVWMSWPQACILPATCAGEGQAGLLLDRQRVHVGADGQRRAWPAAGDGADHAGAAHPGLVRDAEPLQARRRRRRRCGLPRRRVPDGHAGRGGPRSDAARRRPWRRRLPFADRCAG